MMWILEKYPIYLKKDIVAQNKNLKHISVSARVGSGA